MNADVREGTGAWKFALDSSVWIADSPSNRLSYSSLSASPSLEPVDHPTLALTGEWTGLEFGGVVNFNPLSVSYFIISGFRVFGAPGR